MMPQRLQSSIPGSRFLPCLTRGKRSASKQLMSAYCHYFCRIILYCANSIWSQGGNTMRFFEGLYSYEIVLLALGTLMFLMLLFAFVYSLIKKQALGRLFGFFLFPIVMIGFPVVSSIKLMNNLIEITKATRELEQRPTDKSAREDLVTAVQSVAARPLSNPETLTTIAHAQVALGNDAGALT